MFYNIYQGGGGLGLLRPAGIHRRHQGGPAAAQLVERGKLGGAFGSKGPRLRPGRKPLHPLDTEGCLRSPLSWTQSPTRSRPKEVLDLSRRQATFPQRVLFSSSFSRTHHHPLTTSHGLRGPQTHGARLNHRVSAHRKRAPEIVDERLALLGLKCAMLRKQLAPGPSAKLSEHTGEACSGPR